MRVSFEVWRRLRVENEKFWRLGNDTDWGPKVIMGEEK